MSKDAEISLDAGTDFDAGTTAACTVLTIGPDGDIDVPELIAIWNIRKDIAQRAATLLHAPKGTKCTFNLPISGKDGKWLEVGTEDGNQKTLTSDIILKQGGVTVITNDGQYEMVRGPQLFQPKTMDGNGLPMSVQGWRFEGVGTAEADVIEVEPYPDENTFQAYAKAGSTRIIQPDGETFTTVTAGTNKNYVSVNTADGSLQRSGTRTGMEHPHASGPTCQISFPHGDPSLGVVATFVVAGAALRGKGRKVRAKKTLK